MSAPLVAPDATTTAPTRPRIRDTTRWDVQGLRAFAVLAVVVYHLWPNRLPGGFVGVDVFFVISGYLITGHLLREVHRTGRVALASFWARRAKRLLPGAFLAILATGGAVLAFVPSALWGQYGRELIASTVYVQNWQLAADSVDYLASDNQASPFQHFWSLSVEEQFYIALPVLLIVVLWLARRRASAVTVVRVMLGSVAVLSFVWCVVQTDTTPGVAYFSTATRAWEFALGGLASTVRFPVARTTAARTTRLLGAWLGAALLVVALWVVTPDLPFPGSIALLPVAGAALVVLFGAGTELEAIGRVTPVAHLGRISYAVYLWHWPAVVIVPFVTGHQLTSPEKVGILLGAVVVGSLSTMLVEEPLRFHHRVRSWRPRRVALVGVVVTALMASLGVGTLTSLHVQQAQAEQFATSLTRGDVRCFGAAAAIGSDDPCVNPALADVRVPAATIARRDDANRDACWSDGGGQFARCTLGPTSGYDRYFIAMGDSHNNALIDVYERIAKRNNWRIDVAGHPSCYFTAAEQSAPSQGLQQSCDTWKGKAMSFVRSHAADLSAVLVTHSATSRPVLATTDENAEDATVDGLVKAWRTATAAGVPVIAVRDNPIPAPGIVTCVGKMHGATTSECDQSRSAGFAPFEGSERAAARVGSKAHVIDLSDRYCDTTTCPAVIGGVLVYRDKTHITNTFAKTLRPYLERGIRDALAESAR
jgi:peptidoglycan/LPS O-acetylase OafA/YrhL